MCCRGIPMAASHFRLSDQTFVVARSPARLSVSSGGSRNSMVSCRPVSSETSTGPNRRPWPSGSRRHACYAQSHGGHRPADHLSIVSRVVQRVAFAPRWDLGRACGLGSRLPQKLGKNADFTFDSGPSRARRRVRAGRLHVDLTDILDQSDRDYCVVTY